MGEQKRQTEHITWHRHAYYSHVKAFSFGVPPTGVVALVEPPPGFVVAFVVGFVVGVVGRPEIVLNTVNIFTEKEYLARSV